MYVYICKYIYIYNTYIYLYNIYIYIYIYIVTLNHIDTLILTPFLSTDLTIFPNCPFPLD